MVTRLTILFFLLLANVAYAVDVKQWFREQRQPGTEASCCNEADGETVEEDIRGGQYWVRSPMTGGAWIQVPDRVVIKEPNLWGRPVAWFRKNRSSGGVMVFCFAPGALL